MRSIFGSAAFTFAPALAIAALGLAACESSVNMPAESLSTARVGEGVPANLRIAYGNDQSATLATELPLPLAVVVSDRYGDPVPDALVDWTLVEGEGELLETQTRSQSSGLAQVRFRLPPLVGQQKVKARLQGLEPAREVEFELSASAAPNILEATLSKTHPRAGESVTLAVRFADAFDNTRSDYAGTLQLGVSDPAATLPASYTFTSGDPSSDNGVHVFTFVLKTAGSHRISLADPVLSLSRSLSVEVRPGDASQMLLSTDLPASGATYSADSSLPALVLRLVDPFGNLDTGYAGSLSLSLVDPNATGATLAGPASVTVSNGIATVSGRSVRKAGTGYRLRVSGLTASGSPLPSLDSRAFTIVAGAATSLVAQPGSPSSATVASSTAPNAFSVLLKDAYDNPIPNALISWTASRGSTSLSSNITNSAGIASNSLTLPSSAGPLTLSASHASLSPASFNLSANPAPPAQFKLTNLSTPSNPTFPAGACQQLSLSLTDIFDNFTPPSANTTVSLQDDFNNSGSQFFSDSSCSSPISSLSLPSSASAPLNLFFSNPFNGFLRLRASGGGYAGGVLNSNTLSDVASATGDRGLGARVELHTLYLQHASGRLSGSLTPLRGRGTISGLQTSSLGNGSCLGDWGSCSSQVNNWPSPGPLYSFASLSALGPLASPAITGLVTTGMHSCGVGSDTKAYCWGASFNGEVGNGYAGAGDYQAVIATPTSVEGSLGSGVVQVAAGAHESTFGSGRTWTSGFSAARKADGSVYCWGHSTCGTSPLSVKSVPVQVPLASAAIDLSAGYRMACAVLGTGSVQCWGADYGTGVQTIGGVATASKVSVGYQGACALLSGGQVACWGSQNDRGQLGTGDTNAPGATSASAVSGVSGAVELVVMRDRSCVRFADKSLRCWGREPGDGSASSYSPVTVAGIGPSKQIVGVGPATCSLREDGRPQCWGDGRRLALPHATSEGSLESLTISRITSSPQVGGNCGRFDLRLARAGNINVSPQVRDRNNGVDFFSNSDCTQGMTSLNIPAGSLNATIYAKPKARPATAQVEVSAEGFVPALASDLHFSGPPGGIRASFGGAANVPGGVCLTWNLWAVDAAGQSVLPYVGDIAFTASDPGGCQAMTFHSDESCSSAPAPNGVIDDATNSGRIYGKISWGDWDGSASFSSALGSTGAYGYNDCGCGGCGD
jgi:hypothetical protein